MIWKDPVFFNWIQQYLNTIEDIYGEIDLHPIPDIEETNHEWRKCFMQYEQPDNNTIDQEWTLHYMDLLEHIHGPLLEYHYSEIEDINAEWCLNFRTDLKVI